ncbi:hypothetical protein [Sulfitobacter geojensis]|uniref:Uncharacterized protein n=1 Tax=Sulfitobacter geojensis TaxID=1342299 RepID=A0AAE3B7V7_9RHOB|nr:hypothetical protein [Sulfitobacter geojensis]MBM1690645.1 hypothetical protein [Sulfitobacter geojensis]MBM1694711.1 hypothetical protein [Sulfitobacter geojensis]MBM1707583.1 hypothetical protein [Sulfitobacter geojensis]MBM1711193.1 hypothetical protein [Sulfitobacter geojensis]MBM1715708.1 hypothetical protein [Sulfitobacter geojensis]
MSLFSNIMQDVKVIAEKLGSKEASEKLTELLNDRKTVAEAKKKFPKLGDWPLEPSSAVIKFYEKKVEGFWKSERSSYPDVEAKFKVIAKKGASPKVEATLKVSGQWKGGGKASLKGGQSLAKLSTEIYGHPNYAVDILDANLQNFGIDPTKAPTLLAGFPMTMPKIWVPNKLDGKGKLPRVATQPAVLVPFPTMEYPIDYIQKRAMVYPLPHFHVLIDLEFKGTFVGRCKGTINATTDLKSMQTSMARKAGPITGGFKASADAPKAGSTSLTLNVVNTKLSGWKLSADFDLKGGQFKIKLGPKSFKTTEAPFDYEGSVAIMATITIKPNPKKLPEPAKSGVFDIEFDAEKAAWVVVTAGALSTVGTLGVKAVPSLLKFRPPGLTFAMPLMGFGMQYLISGPERDLIDPDKIA